VPKYARESISFYEPTSNKWRCYCEWVHPCDVAALLTLKKMRHFSCSRYTLSEDLSAYSLEKFHEQKSSEDKKFKDFCTREKALADILNQCQTGKITPDGEEVREL